MSIDEDRPKVAGPDDRVPAPYPLFAKGRVVHGFGRGSRELGIPTANLPDSVVTSVPEITDYPAGIYFGFASVGDDLPPTVYPMVMSWGWNPFYKNTQRSMEVHVLHQFEDDFYGAWLRIIVLGYVRAERDYPNLDALVTDIHCDIEVARRSVARPVYAKYNQHAFLMPEENETERVHRESIN